MKARPDTGILIALDPSPAQEKKLYSHCGGARYVYNWCIDLVKEKHEAGESFPVTKANLRKEWNRSKGEIAPWLEKNSKEASSYGCECAANAYKNFFDSCSGKRKGRKCG